MLSNLKYFCKKAYNYLGFKNIVIVAGLSVIDYLLLTTGVKKISSLQSEDNGSSAVYIKNTFFEFVIYTSGSILIEKIIDFTSGYFGERAFYGHYSQGLKEIYKTPSFLVNPKFRS